MGSTGALAVMFFAVLDMPGAINLNANPEIVIVTRSELVPDPERVALTFEDVNPNSPVPLPVVWL